MNSGPMTLELVLGQRVAVWGIGAEGLAFVALAMGRGIEPVLLDDHGDEAAERVQAALGVAVPVVRPADMDWMSVDVVVRSPGVSR